MDEECAIISHELELNDKNMRSKRTHDLDHNLWTNQREELCKLISICRHFFVSIKWNALRKKLIIKTHSTAQSYMWIGGVLHEALNQFSEEKNRFITSSRTNNMGKQGNKHVIKICYRRSRCVLSAVLVPGAVVAVIIFVFFLLIHTFAVAVSCRWCCRCRCCCIFVFTKTHLVCVCQRDKTNSKEFPILLLGRAQCIHSSHTRSLACSLDWIDTTLNV